MKSGRVVLLVARVSADMKVTVEMTTPWLALQLADSAFPGGGFAHSSGLEAAIKWNELRDGDGLIDFIRASLTQTGRSLLPLLRAAHHGASFSLLDRKCDAFLSNHVANRASRSQGQAFLASAVAAFRRPALDSLRELVRQDQLPGHFPPVFGAVAAAMEVTAEDATRLFLFMTLRNLISSAVRLNVVGPLQGQAIQNFLHPYAENVAQRYAELDADEIAQTAPVIDIFQATQDRIYSKLFQS